MAVHSGYLLAEDYNVALPLTGSERVFFCVCLYRFCVTFMEKH